NTMTIEKSVSPITEYNTAINNLSDIRGDLGVIEKELNSILNTLSDQKINYIAANSRILDADFAREYVDLTKANILSQSVNAVSAQGDPLANGILNLFDNTGVGNGSMKTPEELANT
ncbi:MAG: flagellin, partial [bacterium]